MLKKFLLPAVSALILCGCDTIRTELARDPESGLVWHDPRYGTTSGSTYTSPAGDVEITLPEHTRDDASLYTYKINGGFGFRFFDVSAGTWQLESRAMPHLNFEKCFTDDQHLQKIIAGTGELYKIRYNAKFCEYIVDVKDKTIYFLFFLKEGSSATADGKRMDVYLSTAMFELNGKMYWITYEPALSDHHVPIEIIELEALRKCRKGIRSIEKKK